jgi:hypothetical protein
VGTLRRALPLALVAIAVALYSALPATAGKQKGKVHKPPYKKGPSGGDEFNYIHADPESGEMGILRLFPGIPPVVGCAPEPSAGWAMFRIKHRVTEPVASVTVRFEAALDPYAWITAGVRNERGRWLGVKKMQGPYSGESKIKVRLHERPRMHSRVTVEFGLQLGDACPQVGGAMATFPRVRVGG